MQRMNLVQTSNCLLGSTYTVNGRTQALQLLTTAVKKSIIRSTLIRHFKKRPHFDFTNLEPFSHTVRVHRLPGAVRSFLLLCIFSYLPCLNRHFIPSTDFPWTCWQKTVYWGFLYMQTLFCTTDVSKICRGGETSVIAGRKPCCTARRSRTWRAYRGQCDRALSVCDDKSVPLKAFKPSQIIFF